MDLRPQLPGTLFGLLDAGTRLYRALETSDDLLGDALDALAHVEQALRRGDAVQPLLFEISAMLRLGGAGRAQTAATLRAFAPHGATGTAGQQLLLPRF